MKQFALPILLAVSAAAHSQVLYSTNFDDWNAGSNGLSIADPLNASKGWDSGSTDASIVANGQANAGGVTAYSGSQMLRMTSTSAATDWAWKEIGNAWNKRTPGLDALHISTMFYIPAANKSFAYFGVAAYTPDLDYIADVAVAPTYAGSDVGGGAAVFSGARTGLLGTQKNTLIDQLYLKGGWRRLDLVLDMSNENFYAGHAKVDFGNYSTDLGPFYIYPELTNKGIGEIDFFAEYDSQSRTGSLPAQNSVYFDDFKVEAVPEPATFVALGFGAFGLLGRRRKRA